MKSKLKSTVKYLQFVDCTLDAAKENDASQDMPPPKQEKAYFGLPKDQYTNMTTEVGT